MTKIYYTQQEVEADIKDGVLAIEGNVKFECSISIKASIIAGNIIALNIIAGNITAGNIIALNIIAGNITAGDINALNINAGGITALNINAGGITASDINAWNITAEDINAGDILYYAFCCVYQSIKCISIKAKREKHQEPICLEGKLEIKSKEEDEVEKAIKLLQEKGRIVDGKIIK